MSPLVKVAIKHALQKLELVDRTEFDAQSEALSKAREHAKQLEHEVLELGRRIEVLSRSEK